MVLCGGFGERLWPASRPWRPKPFLRLAGEHTGLQETLLRAALVAKDGGEVVVSAAAAQAATVRQQQEDIGVAARSLLEPVGRGTAAAIAASAAWVASQRPDAVVVALPADHHITDTATFLSAIRVAIGAAGDGGIVTLGLCPAAATPALGYIVPGKAETAVKPIAAFLEKPSAEAAAALIERGALWNSGVFVAQAAVLLSELARWAPAVSEAAKAAVTGALLSDGQLHLGESFSEAPAGAFDRAVMEKSDRGRVLPVGFAWSDLGTWDEVWRASSQDGCGVSLEGDAQAISSSNLLVRAAPGMRVAVVGGTRLAVIAERDAVLVCGLDHAQDVRGLGATPRRFADLAGASAAYEGWLRTAALPVWATVGVDPDSGAFREALTWDGAPFDPRRRTRVLARQAFVYAQAAADGAPGPWLRAAREGFDYLLRHGRRPDGLFMACLNLEGRPIDREAYLYEQAFVLLALAGLAAAEPGEPAHASEAAALRDRLAAFRHGAGGFREAGPQPFQANAQMHLFEAALAWEALDPAWAALADEIAELALGRLICAESGALREFFDADWRPLGGEAGLIEPGHQFEWAWLLERWGRARRESRAQAAARKLFEVGRRGFDLGRGVVANALDDSLGVRDAGARLWPQTEHLKAALILGEETAALEAANGIAAYLDTPVRGLWRERMRADGGFVEEPSPATSLYHLFVAMRELAQAW